MKWDSAEFARSTNELSGLQVLPAEGASDPADCGASRPIQTVGKPVRVTLVRPAFLSGAGTYSTPLTPPLGLAYLAATLEEAGARVQAIDAVGEFPEHADEADGYVRRGLSVEETVARIDPEADLIGVSCMFTQDWPFAKRLLAAIRARFPDKMIVAGGEHITALPQMSLEQAPAIDLLVLGEGEETIVDLVSRWGDREAVFQTPGTAFLRDGQLVRNGSRKRVRDVDALPLPAWHHFPMEVYLENRNGHGVYRGRTMGIIATRGCPYKCTFCSNPLMYGQLWLPRNPASVLDEIELYMQKYGATNIDFYDLTFVIRKSWIMEFCRLIEERGLKFTWQLPTGTRSEVIDGEVAAALYRTGCRNIAYAPESGSEETLKIIKKQVHLDNLVESIRAVLAQGMVVRVNIILGFPHERRRHFVRSVLFGWKLALLGVHDAGFYRFSPYPGTELFEQLRRDGLIKALDDEYFKALLAFKNFFASNPYSPHMSGLEINLWQVFGMASFFALQYLRRPWRFGQLIWNVFRNRGVTALEQRLGVMYDQRRKRRAAKQAAAAPASSVPAAATISG